MEIDVGDCASEGEPNRNADAELPPCRGDQGRREPNHEAADAIQGPRIEMICDSLTWPELWPLADHSDVVSSMVSESLSPRATQCSSSHLWKRYESAR